MKKTATGAASTVLTGISRYVPYINWAFYAADFLNGYNNAATYLGVADDEVNSIWPGWGAVLRIIVGVANVLNNKVTLGIIPLTSIIDVFVNYLAPVFGLDTEKLIAAREETAKELEKFNKKNGTEFDLKKYNKYQKGTSGYNIFARTAALLPWTETHKLINEVEEKQAQAATNKIVNRSQTAATNINRITDSDLSTLLKNYNTSSPYSSSDYNSSNFTIYNCCRIYIWFILCY